jgi:excisionase family DNA binding protein
MCCHGLFVIMRLYALLAGKFTLVGNRSVEGNRARTIGLVLILPTVITLCAVAAQVDSGPSGTTLNRRTATQLDSLSCILLIGALIVAAYLTLTAPPGTPAYATVSPLDDQSYYPPGMLSGTSQAPPEKTILSLPDAAAYLRISESDLLALVESGRIEAGRFGTQYRFSKESLDAYLDQQSGGTV